MWPYTTQLFAGSDLARASVDCELGFSYGLGDREKVDIYGMKTLPGGTCNNKIK